MSKREDQAFAAWIEEVKSSLSSDDEVEAFDAFVNSDGGREIFRGTLREQDYYTKLNKLNAEKEELKAAQEELATWYENEEPIREQIIKERDELKKQMEASQGQPGDNPPSQVAGVSPEEFAMIRAKAAKVDAIDRLIPQVLGQMGAVIQDSMKNGYEVDAREIMQTSMQQGIDPYQAYHILTEEQRKKRAEAAHEEERKKWYEEGRQAALSGQAPDHITPSGPSMFDLLSESNQVAPADKQPSAVASQRVRVDEAMRQFREGDF